MHECKATEPIDETALDTIKKSISKCSIKFSSHKKEHKNEFTIDDIERIIKITATQ